MKTADALKIGMALGRISKTLDAWEESKHPRADNGQFSSGGGGGGVSGGKSKETHLHTIAGAYASASQAAKKGDYTAYKNHMDFAKKAVESAKKAGATEEEITKMINRANEYAFPSGGGSSSSSGGGSSIGKKSKPSNEDLKNAKHGARYGDDRAVVKIDGTRYVKIGEDKWEYQPNNPHAMTRIYPTERIAEEIQKAKSVEKSGTW